MRTQFVVIVLPPIGNLSNFVKTTEEIELQHFFPARPVEPFDISVLVWLARLDVANHHPGIFRPLHKFVVEEFLTVIGPC